MASGERRSLFLGEDLFRRDAQRPCTPRRKDVGPLVAASDGPGGAAKGGRSRPGSLAPRRRPRRDRRRVAACRSRSRRRRRAISRQLLASDSPPRGDEEGIGERARPGLAAPADPAAPHAHQHPLAEPGLEVWNARRSRARSRRPSPYARPRCVRRPTRRGLSPRSPSRRR